MQNFKDKREYRLGVLPRTLSPTRTTKTFWWAAMLFCSHAVETTVETGPDLATSSDSKVSGFNRPHVSEKYRIQKFPLWRADSKVSGFAGRIHRLRVDERRVRKEEYTDSNVSGYVWTGPKTMFPGAQNIMILYPSR